MAECHLNLCLLGPIMLLSPHRTRSHHMSPTIEIRPARHTDAAALRDLAGLDSALPLEGDALVAIVDAEPVAALSLADGRAIADPFRRTADIVDLLRLRAAGHGERETARPRVALRARLGLAS